MYAGFDERKVGVKIFQKKKRSGSKCTKCEKQKKLKTFTSTFCKVHSKLLSLRSNPASYNKKIRLPTIKKSASLQ